MRLEGLGKSKKIHFIGIRTRDLPACSIVSQPTTIKFVSPYTCKSNEGSLNKIGSKKWNLNIYTYSPIFFFFLLLSSHGPMTYFGKRVIRPSNFVWENPVFLSAKFVNWSLKWISSAFAIYSFINFDLFYIINRQYLKLFRNAILFLALTAHAMHLFVPSFPTIHIHIQTWFWHYTVMCFCD
jgi:hypothetical protein